MEFIILLAVFLSVFSFSFFIIPRYLEYQKKIKIEEIKMIHYDLIRRRSLLGRIRPLLQYIAVLNSKNKFTNMWVNNNRVRCDALLNKAGSPGNISAEEFLVLKQITPIYLTVIFSAFFFRYLFLFFTFFLFFLDSSYLIYGLMIR